MPTLREVMAAKTAALETQIEGIKQQAKDAITPRQAKLYELQAQRERLAPYLDTEATLVPDAIAAAIAASPK